MGKEVSEILDGGRPVGIRRAGILPHATGGWNEFRVLFVGRCGRFV